MNLGLLFPVYINLHLPALNLEIQTGYFKLVTAISVIVDFFKEYQYISGAEVVFKEVSGFHFYKNIYRDIH